MLDRPSKVGPPLSSDLPWQDLAPVGRTDQPRPLELRRLKVCELPTTLRYGLSNIYGMRPRELWFWLGAGFLTIGGVLTAVAIAYFTKEKHYSLGTGPQMVLAYTSYVFAFLCFLAAIAGWRPWLRWQRFPNLTIRVDGVGNETATTQVPNFPPRPTLLYTLIIHIINAEADRSVSIRAMYLLAKAKRDWFSYFQLFSKPYDPVSRIASSPVDALRFPVNLVL